MIDHTATAPLPLTQRRAQPLGMRLRNLVKLDIVWVPALLLLHMALGMLFAQSSIVATVHFGLVVLVAAGCIFASSFSLARMACFAAYVTGAETLWRMSKASIPWEIAKYVVIALLVASLVRAGRLRAPILPLVFFLLLLPAIVLPLSNLSWELLQQELSFNLSGPLALTVSLWFFSNVRLSTRQLHGLLLAGICPALAVASFTLYGILTAKTLVFTHGSNAALSGGFGPAQVSAALGFGALLTFLWVIDASASPALRIVLVALLLYFLGQCALTFSRGGLYMAIGGATAAALFAARDRKTRLALCGILLVVSAAFTYLVLPRLDQFTEGKFAKRLQDTGLTGRDDMISGDLKVFADHMIFGVGPGQTGAYRAQVSINNTAHAHTEFTRLLAEHGLFGAAALLVLALISAQNFLAARTPRGRGLVLAVISWALIFMSSLAMRLVAPSFMFGLSAVSLLPPDSATRRTSTAHN
mgnify:CR=1 FL=1